MGEGEGSDPPPSPRQKPDLPLHAGRELLPVGVAAFIGCMFQQMLPQRTSRGRSLGCMWFEPDSKHSLWGEAGLSLALDPLQLAASWVTLMLVSTSPARAAPLLPTGLHQGFWGRTARHWLELAAAGATGQAAG